MKNSIKLVEDELSHAIQTTSSTKSNGIEIREALAMPRSKKFY